jgi:gag-polypeptide of LTR copia-type
MSVCVMLASLDENYEPLITALEAWDSKKHTVEAVRAKLVEEFSRKHPDGDEARSRNENISASEERPSNLLWMREARTHSSQLQN